MIGGQDIVIELAGVPPSSSLPAAVRYLVDRWPSAVLQDGDTGQRFAGFASVDFGRLREVFVYRDEQAFASWERLGADSSNANQMVHVLASAGRVTLVVDDARDVATASIMRDLRDRLEHGMPWFAPMVQEAA